MVKTLWKTSRDHQNSVRIHFNAVMYHQVACFEQFQDIHCLNGMLRKQTSTSLDITQVQNPLPHQTSIPLKYLAQILKVMSEVFFFNSTMT